MRQGDFENLLHEHAGLLARIAASYEADPSLRDDLLQDIALALWRALPAWRGEASLKTFVARVAHNRAATHSAGHRRWSTNGEVPEQWRDQAPGPEDRAGADQRRLRLQAAVRALPIGLRQAVTLALEDFDHAEIAEALGISVSNVGVRLHRARDALKRRLGDMA